VRMLIYVTLRTDLYGVPHVARFLGYIGSGIPFVLSMRALVRHVLRSWTQTDCLVSCRH
jgi:uncharacterized membrane protein